MDASQFASRSAKLGRGVVMSRNWHWNDPPTLGNPKVGFWEFCHFSDAEEDFFSILFQTETDVTDWDRLMCAPKNWLAV